MGFCHRFCHGWLPISSVMYGATGAQAGCGVGKSDVTVEQGRTKKSVAVSGSITVVNAMSQLYMTIKVK